MLLIVLGMLIAGGAGAFTAGPPTARTAPAHLDQPRGPNSSTASGAGGAAAVSRPRQHCRTIVVTVSGSASNARSAERRSIT
jgi:hypothetical protein